MPTALITGITGQDGSYLAELLLKKGYEVYGLMRRCSTPNLERIAHLPDLKLRYADLGDGSCLTRLMEQIKPREIYNLGAMSHVRVSYDVPEYTADITGTGAIRILEAAKEACPEARIYQASSSEMFGSAPPPQSELTPFHPRSPYGCAKVFAYWATVNYREAYGMHASNGILFNHESPRRGEGFVTRKITKAIGRIRAGTQDKLFLGNLDAKRDWGFAGDFVEAMWLMTQQQKPDDYVIATGETHSVREFLDIAFDVAGLPHWSKYVEIDPRLYRPAEVDVLLGDPTKAKQLLGWEPTMSFKRLVEVMVKNDYVYE